MGNPVRLIGGPGQENDITHAHELINGFAAAATIADKGYDANHLHEKIVERGGEIVIPPKRNRKVQRSYDVDLYKERNLIERFFNKLKQLSTRWSPYLYEVEEGAFKRRCRECGPRHAENGAPFSTPAWAYRRYRPCEKGSHAC